MNTYTGLNLFSSLEIKTFAFVYKYSVYIVAENCCLLCSFGASVVVEGYIPNLYQHLISNTLCFIQHETAGVYPQMWKERNVSALIFRDTLIKY